jgi:DDE family transposase
MGDAKAGPVYLSFNPQLRVEFRGATVTSDAGLLLPRELDERLGLSALIERHLSDPRTGYNRQFPLPDLFRQSIYEDTNDAERLAEDPTFRMLASRERRASSVALTSTLHWFETEALTEEDNHQGLTRLNTALVQRAATVTGRVTLDIDSSESPVHGAQEQAAYNGHFESVCYHPLFVFNQKGDCLAAKLRPATSPVRAGGRRSSCPSLIVTRIGNRASSFAPTQPLRFPRSTGRWSSVAWRTPRTTSASCYVG